MKARHFKKLRKTLQYFLIEETSKAGNWNAWKDVCDARKIWGDVVIATSVGLQRVLASDTESAMRRYKHRKGYTWSLTNRTHPSMANFRIAPAKNPFTRFVTYWN